MPEITVQPSAVSPKTSVGLLLPLKLDELFEAGLFPDDPRSPAAKEVSLSRDAIRLGLKKLTETGGLIPNSVLIDMFRLLKGRTDVPDSLGHAAYPTTTPLEVMAVAVCDWTEIQLPLTGETIPPVSSCYSVTWAEQTANLLTFGRHRSKVATHSSTGPNSRNALNLLREKDVRKSTATSHQGA